MRGIEEHSICSKRILHEINRFRGHCTSVPEFDLCRAVDRGGRVQMGVFLLKGKRPDSQKGNSRERRIWEWD